MMRAEASAFMSLARDVTTVGTATLFSRLLGFFRDVGIAAVLGAGGLSDAYFAALQIPNLFRRLLAEGALNSAFVPMWLRIREERGVEGTRRFGERTLGTMLVALGIIAVICVVFAPEVVRVLAPGFQTDGERFALAVDFVRLSIPYIAVAGPVAVAASVLNAEGRVGAAAFALVVFNGVFVAAVAFVILIGGKASFFAGAALSVAVVLAGLAQLILVGAALMMRQDVRPRRISARATPEVRRFFAQAIPGVVAGGIPQLKLMAGAMVASSSQAAVSWLYYANRLYELPLGVVSIAISAVLVPTIAAGVRSAKSEVIAAAPSARAIPRPSRRRSRRSVRDCPGTRSRRCSARCPLPARTRARRWLRRSRGLRPPSSEPSLRFPITAMWASPPPSPSPAGSARRCWARSCGGADGSVSTATACGGCRASSWRRWPWESRSSACLNSSRRRPTRADR